MGNFVGHNVTSGGAGDGASCNWMALADGGFGRHRLWTFRPVSAGRVWLSRYAHREFSGYINNCRRRHLGVSLAFHNVVAVFVIMGAVLNAGEAGQGYEPGQCGRGALTRGCG